MKKLADPVMAAYAKEIGADAIYAQDQRDQVTLGRGPAARSPRRAGAFCRASTSGRMRKLIDGYYRLLTWLLVATVGDPDRSGDAADRLALSPQLIPR